MLSRGRMFKKAQFIAIFVVAVISLTVGTLSALAWSGKVINSQTGEPVEGAVIVRSWQREDATPAGSMHSFLGMTETVTDKDGQFTASEKTYLPGIPLLSQVIEQRPIIFRPGYKFLVAEKNEPVIKLDKIPIIIEERKKEVDRARDNYEVDFYKTQVLKKMISEEEEFIESRWQEATKELQRFSSEATERRPQPLQKRERITDKAKIKGLIRTLSDNNAPNKDRVESAIEAARHMDRVEAAIEAARLLGESGDPDVIEPLIDILNSKGPMAWAAADALGNFKEQRVIRALADALGDDVLGSWASMVIRQMGPLAAEALLEKTRDSDPKVRRLAAVLLADTKDPGAVESVIGMLGDKDPGVREHAAFALANFKDPRTVGPLISLWNDDERKVREQASRTLASISRVAIQQLIKELASENWYIRWRSAWCLGRSRDTSAVESLLNAFDDKDERVRWTAVDAFDMRLRDKRAAKKLIELCFDHDAGIRESVETALRNLSGKNICQESTKRIDLANLMNELRSDDPAIRRKAAEYAGDIGAKELSSRLQKLSKRSNKLRHLRWQVNKILGMLQRK